MFPSLKPEMWAPLAAEIGHPWRAVEAMHWKIGEMDMAHRAGIMPFSLASTSPSATLPTANLQPGTPDSYRTDGGRTGYEDNRTGGPGCPRRGTTPMSPELNAVLGPRSEPTLDPPFSQRPEAGEGGPRVVLPSFAEVERDCGLGWRRAQFGRYREDWNLQ
jgi:hypothetical protein